MSKQIINIKTNVNQNKDEQKHESNGKEVKDVSQLSLEEQVLFETSFLTELISFCLISQIHSELENQEKLKDITSLTSKIKKICVSPNTVEEIKKDLKSLYMLMANKCMGFKEFILNPLYRLFLATRLIYPNEQFPNKIDEYYFSSREYADKAFLKIEKIHQHPLNYILSIQTGKFIDRIDDSISFTFSHLEFLNKKHPENMKSEKLEFLKTAREGMKKYPKINHKEILNNYKKCLLKKYHNSEIHLQLIDDLFLSSNQLFLKKEKLAFLMGSHKNMGNNSQVSNFFSSSLFDINLFQEIFSYIESENKNTLLSSLPTELQTKIKSLQKKYDNSKDELHMVKGASLKFLLMQLASRESTSYKKCVDMTTSKHKQSTQGLFSELKKLFDDISNCDTEVENHQHIKKLS